MCGGRGGLTTLQLARPMSGPGSFPRDASPSGTSKTAFTTQSVIDHPPIDFSHHVRDSRSSEATENQDRSCGKVASLSFSPPFHLYLAAFNSRLIKEVAVYRKEEENEQKRVDKLKAEGAEGADLRNAVSHDSFVTATCASARDLKPWLP